ncbi:MAG: hypothetical protein ABI041_15495, partial [Bdellovibrionia bacterium]
MSLAPIVVVGDGWAALAAVGFLASTGVEVRWIEGSGTKMSAPLSSMESGIALDICSELGRQLGVELGEYQQGSFIREFRNKSFRQPPWMKAPEPKARLEVRDELLWAPETRIASVLSAKFSISMAEVEELFRGALSGPRFRNLQRIEGVPLSGIQIDEIDTQNSMAEGEDKAPLVVSLANGQSIRCRQIIYADRWSLLRKLKGFPKTMKFIQKRDPMGALQAVFEHKSPVGVGVSESFYAPLHKENGEEIERNLWGYFSSDGMRSFWTLCLAEEEVENNHEIAKKFRRLKSTLDRIFTGDVFIPKVPQDSGDLENLPGNKIRVPEIAAKFTANIIGEQVRLVEDAVFSAGEMVTEPVTLPQLHDVVFLTDGYGPAAALQQVGSMLG